MPGRIAKRLAELGINLPNPQAPVASYVPTVITGNLIFISGQVCIGEDGKFITGKAGQTSTSTSRRTPRGAADWRRWPNSTPPLATSTG